MINMDMLRKFINLFALIGQVWICVSGIIASNGFTDKAWTLVALGWGITACYNALYVIKGFSSSED